MEVIWEKEINDIDTCLWYAKDREYSFELLDNFYDFLKNLSEKIIIARKALEEYLNEDSEYIDFHIEEVELNDLPDNVEDFVSEMQVTGVSLWIDNELGITMDFMISPEESDEILCVSFDINGEIVDIAWES